jgi:hypothetical protein
MALVVKNTKQLINPETLKLKILLVSQPGFGKTTFVANSPNPIIGVCETGHGQGLLSIASKGVDYTELDSYDDFDAFCSGAVGKENETFGLDSLSDMGSTFIKDKALSLPRAKGESQKRALGVPELDDYGVMAELTRKLLRKLLGQGKHVVATSGMRIDKPDPENGQGEMLIGPALPGQMFLGSTAMFDLVLIGRTRSILRDPRDAKSRYTERYWLTEPSNGFLAKNRLSIGEESKSFLPTELIYNPKANTGTFDDIFQRAMKAYAEEAAKQVAKTTKILN